jgi:hypothetical protein
VSECHRSWIVSGADGTGRGLDGSYEVVVVDDVPGAADKGEEGDAEEEAEADDEGITVRRT